MTISKGLLIVAVILFVLAAIPVTLPFNAIALGLAFGFGSMIS